METRTIDQNSEIKLYADDKKPFYGPNSLLSIKAVRVPFERKDSEIMLKIFYKNTSGLTFSFPLLLYPPYFFQAVTPNFNDNTPETSQIPFQWAEIRNEAPFELTISVSLNTELHTNLNTFRKNNE